MCFDQIYSSLPYFRFLLHPTMFPSQVLVSFVNPLKPFSCTCLDGCGTVWWNRGSLWDPTPEDIWLFITQKPSIVNSFSDGGRTSWILLYPSWDFCLAWFPAHSHNHICWYAQSSTRIFGTYCFSVDIHQLWIIIFLHHLLQRSES